MATPKYTKAEPVSLKSHPAFNEKWLQQEIASDTSLLGLGDLTLKDAERRQPRAGRLDLLLSDPETSTRYEVEIQLGATDESHIIRTIEYWDIENQRYPMYDHIAVIVAEDVTSRFLNVISLLNRSVPLIAIQLSAWQVGSDMTLTATKVVDLVAVVDDEEEPGEVTDRSYWTRKTNPTSVNMADRVLDLVQEATGDNRLALKYNKPYIGLARDGVPDNFVTVTPRKTNEYVVAELKVPRSDELTARIEDAGITVNRYDTGFRCYNVRLTPSDLVENRELLTEIIQRASGLKPAAESEELEAKQS